MRYLDFKTQTYIFLSLTSLYIFAAFMLSTQLNYMAEKNILVPNTVCILKRHVTNILKDGRYAFFSGNFGTFFFFFFLPTTFGKITRIIIRCIHKATFSLFTDEL